VRVQINGRYAYDTDLDDVEVGDEMVLPGSGAFRESWYGIVTALDPDYRGPCRKAIGLSRRRAAVDAEKAALADVKISGWRAGDTITKKCPGCDRERTYRVETVNTIGRPVTITGDSCTCGAFGGSGSYGSAEAFRYFMIEGQS
jgi:uncharacterized Zn-binding protein involved in type VI secretion